MANKKQQSADDIFNEALVTQESENADGVFNEDLSDQGSENADDIFNEALGEQPEEISKLESFGRGAAQDASLGFADEIIGAGEAGLTKLGILGTEAERQQDLLDLYEKYRNESREANKLAEEQNPKSYMAGEVTGMIAPLIATGGAAAAGSLAKTGIKQAAKQGAKELVKDELLKQTTKEVAKNALKLSASGAAISGVNSIGMSEKEDIEQLLKDAAGDAAVGGVLSPLIPGAVKTVGKTAKKVGRGIKNVGKTTIKWLSQIKDPDDFQKIIDKSDHFKDALSLPEIKEQVLAKTQTIADNIGIKSQKALESLSDEKVIHKDELRKLISKRINNAKSKDEAMGIPALTDFMENMIDNPETRQNATKEALNKLQLKMEQAVVKSSRITPEQSAQRSLKALQDKIEKETIKNTELGVRSSFTPPKVDINTNLVYTTDVVTGKVISQPIKTSSVKFSKPKIHKNFISVVDESTGKTITEQISKEFGSEMFPGELLSLRDLHKIKQFAQKRGYKQETDDANKHLRMLSHEMNELLNTHGAPPVYKQYNKEISNTYDILKGMKEKFGVKVDYDKVKVTTDDKFSKKLEEVGKKTARGTEYKEVNSLLKKLDDLRGLKDNISTPDKLEINRLQSELGKDESQYSFAVRSIVSSMLAAGLGGPSGLIAATAGLTARPGSRLLLKKAGSLKRAAKKMGQSVDKASELGAPLGVAAGLSSKPKVAISDNTTEAKLDNPGYTEGLIEEFKNSESPGKQSFANQLERYQNSEDSQEKRQIRKSLSEQKAFRKLLEEHDKLKGKNKN